MSRTTSRAAKRAWIARRPTSASRTTTGSNRDPASPPGPGLRTVGRCDRRRVARCQPRHRGRRCVRPAARSSKHPRCWSRHLASAIRRSTRPSLLEYRQTGGLLLVDVSAVRITIRSPVAGFRPYSGRIARPRAVASFSNSGPERIVSRIKPTAPSLPRMVRKGYQYPIGHRPAMAGPKYWNQPRPVNAPSGPHHFLGMDGHVETFPDGSPRTNRRSTPSPKSSEASDSPSRRRTASS